MIENRRPEKEKMIKDIRNLFRLKKLLNQTAIKDIRDLLRWEKETEEIKNRILRYIKNLFEHEKEEENYYKPLRINNFGVVIILNMKVTVTEIKHYQLKNILIKLDLS